MKKSLLAFLVLALTFMSCNNDLNINAPWRDVTVVYSLLDEQKDTNWVRIHRGYLGDQGIYGGNQNEDSLYYKNIIVTIREIRLNGDSTDYLLGVGVPGNGLDSGFFTQQGYRSYHFEEPVNVASEYRLVIDKPDGEGDRVTSITPIVSDFNIKRPIGQQKLTFGLKGQDFTWEEANNARMYQGYLRFYYVEINADNHSDSVRTYVDYNLPTKLGRTLTGSYDITVNVDYSSFYRFLYNAIGVDENVIRFYRGLDVNVVAAADDYTTYINVSQPAEGIVQDKPLYTNVSNGIGIFSSRTSTNKLGMELSPLSTDSLVRGIYTCELMFGRPSFDDTCYCLVPGSYICE